MLTLPATAATVLVSGECGASGNDVIWTLDRDGLLTVSGAGAMYDYDSAYDVPWHSYLDQIKSVVINDGVTTVGKNAFQSCAQLTSVTLPATGLLSIGDVAFYHCDALSSIDIPEGVADIGYNAFGFCALTTFQVPASVKNIGESALYQCAALSAVAVTDGNTAYSALDGVLFDHDQTLLICYPAQKAPTEYALPETVQKVGNYAFHYNPKLQKVTFPEVENGGILEIGSYAFAHSVVSELVIPPSLTTVGDYAFYACAGLSDDEGNALGSVHYGGDRQQWNALTIGDGNYRLTNANIIFGDMKQDNVIASGECGSLGNNASWSLSKEGEFLVSGKGSMKDYRAVADLPWYAYGDEKTDLRPQILTVRIAEGVAHVGDYAFYDCNELTDVKLSPTIESIGARTFSDCDKLANINLSESATKSIGNYAFNGCSALASVTFPDTLLTVGQRAFLDCSALTEITLPSSVTAVEDWAFRRCAKLVAFVMEPLQKDEESHYTSLGSYVLADCAALETLSFTENLTVLGDYALNKCAKLSAVTLPANVSRVGNCAFLGCSALESVNVDGDNQTYYANESGVLMNRDQTYILYYPSGRASSACSIPESVTGVASYAFQEASKLTTVYYEGTPSQWNRDVVPNIGTPNDPLAAIINNTAFLVTGAEENFKCAKEDDDPDDASSVDSILQETTEDGGAAVLVSVHCGRNALGAMALCAWYDDGERFLSMDAAELATPGTDYDLQFLIPDGAAELRIFVMDGDNIPQCKCVLYDEFYDEPSE